MNEQNIYERVWGGSLYMRDETEGEREEVNEGNLDRR